MCLGLREHCLQGAWEERSLDLHAHVRMLGYTRMALSCIWVCCVHNPEEFKTATKTMTTKMNEKWCNTACNCGASRAGPMPPQFQQCPFPWLSIKRHCGASVCLQIPIPVTPPSETQICSFGASFPFRLEDESPIPSQSPGGT